MDERRSQLETWVRSLSLSEQMGDNWTLEVVSGDASFRRYFRIRRDAQSWIAVDAPPETEDSATFIEIGQQLSDFCHVPQVVASDLHNGFMLLSDFGDQLFFGALQSQDPDVLYPEALSVLRQIQQCPSSSLEPYSTTFLKQEMSLFDEWFWSGLLSIQESAKLELVYDLITRTLYQQPKVFVHRDYHSRNLMVLGNGQLGVIDFQGALAGPITYDLVSLLKDCYVVWPRQKVLEWVQLFYQHTLEDGLITDETSLDTFIQWFDWMGVQRHLKVLGIFSRLYLRDGKPGYLKDIPTTYQYLLETTGLYSELKPVYDLLNNPVRVAMNNNPIFQQSIRESDKK